MSPRTSAKPETKSAERGAKDQRQRESQADIWDIKPDADTDTRFIITDWASI